MSNTGTYALLLYLAEDTQLQIGALGTFDFPAGYYAYVGSALGPGGLPARLQHHLSAPDRCRWHIDYLRQAAAVQEIWLSPGDEPREQAWAELMVAVPGATVLVEGFGASDSDADSHLFYFDIKPSLEDFAVGVRAWFPDEVMLRAYEAT
jgi:Uri superfamily endonuclease